MKSLFLFTLMFTTQLFSQVPMGQDAVEIADALNHPISRGCMMRAKMHEVTNIDKVAGQCRGCNTYKIHGWQKDSKDEVVVTLSGSGIFMMGEFTQDYACDVKVIK